MNLIESREKVITNAQEVFKDKAIEAHLFGSVARGDADAYSDIDVWFTISDDQYQDVYENRFEYYKQLGTVVHFCEPPQNAPIGGVHTALIIEMDQRALLMVDLYLCPQTTSFVTEDSKKLFGIDLH